MNEEINTLLTDEETNDTAEETAQDEDRPPRDPKNGLYTFLSILIFVVCYAGIKLAGAHFSLTYALYEDVPSEELVRRSAEAFGAADTITQPDVDYVRIHRNFDNDRLYLSVSLGCDEDEAAEMIPFEHGDPAEGDRYTILPTADMHERTVFGQLYVCSRDPSMYCIIYEDGDTVHALFSTAVYDKDIRLLFDGEKIAADSRQK